MNADQVADRIAKSDPWPYIASAYDQAIGQSYDSMLVRICQEFLKNFAGDSAQLNKSEEGKTVRRVPNRHSEEPQLNERNKA
jgi:hypothetical protein